MVTKTSDQILKEHVGGGYNTIDDRTKVVWRVNLRSMMKILNQHGGKEGLKTNDEDFEPTWRGGGKGGGREGVEVQCARSQF